MAEPPSFFFTASVEESVKVIHCLKAVAVINRKIMNPTGIKTKLSPKGLLNYVCLKL